MAKRQNASDYLRAILEQALADETNGRTTTKEQILQGEVEQSMAHRLRTSLAEDLAQKAKGIDAFDAARWLVEKDPAAELQIQGMNMLRRIEAPESATVFKTILAEPHPIGAVLVGAIEEVGKRHLVALTPDVLRLQNHYRSPSERR